MTVPRRSSMPLRVMICVDTNYSGCPPQFSTLYNLKGLQFPDQKQQPSILVRYLQPSKLHLDLEALHLSQERKKDLEKVLIDDEAENIVKLTLYHQPGNNNNNNNNNDKVPAATPQLRRHIFSKGAVGLILTAHPECTTVYSLKLETAQ
ncbi:regulator of chromosome condensation family protein, partial [Striga asiatica]